MRLEQRREGGRRGDPMRWCGRMPARAMRRSKEAWYGASDEEGAEEEEEDAEQRNRRRRRSRRHGEGEERRERRSSGMAGVGGDRDYGSRV